MADVTNPVKHLNGRIILCKEHNRKAGAGGDTSVGDTCVRIGGGGGTFANIPGEHITK